VQRPIEDVEKIFSTKDVEFFKVPIIQELTLKNRIALGILLLGKGTLSKLYFPV